VTKTQRELVEAKKELRTLEQAKTALRRVHQPTQLIELEMQRIRVRMSALRAQWSMA
jgi:hypothetical protein